MVELVSMVLEIPIISFSAVVMIFIMEGMEQISSMVVPETLGEYLKQRPEVFPVQQVI